MMDARFKLIFARLKVGLRWGADQLARSFQGWNEPGFIALAKQGDALFGKRHWRGSSQLAATGYHIL